MADKGTCPECGKKIALRNDGRLRGHGTRRYSDSRWCAGAWELPKEAVSPPEQNGSRMKIDYDKLVLDIGTERWIGGLDDRTMERYVVDWVVKVSLLGDEEDDVTPDVATAIIKIFHFSEAAYGSGRSLSDILDEVSAESLSYMALFDDDNFIEEELDAAGSAILILDRVTVAPEFRGHGIGPFVAAMAMREMRAGCALAACIPWPIEDVKDLTDAEIQAEVKRLGTLWSKIGFTHYRAGVWVLNLTHKTLDEVIERLR